MLNLWYNPFRKKKKLDLNKVAFTVVTYGTDLSGEITSSIIIANKKILKVLISINQNSGERVLVLTYQKYAQTTFATFQILGTGKKRRVILSVADGNGISANHYNSSRAKTVFFQKVCYNVFKPLIYVEFFYTLVCFIRFL